MEEAFSQTAGKLVPLLILLGIVFGALIAVALVLRARVRREAGAQPVRRRGSAAQLQADDVLSVLGRMYTVEAVETLATDDGPALWCVLTSETEPARLALARDVSWAIQFPGRGPAPEGEVFPVRIEHNGAGYRREGEPVQLGQGWRLARYQGEGGLWLAVEQRGATDGLWRGKEIPAEGIEVLEDEPGPDALTGGGAASR